MRAIAPVALTDARSTAVPVTLKREGSPVGLGSARLTIEPPAYLGEPSRRIDGLDAELPEGSAVTWDIALTGEAAGLSLVGADAQEELRTEKVGENRFRARATMADNRLYQLAVTSADGARVLWPQVHTLKTIRDQPPRLTWQAPVVSRTVIDPAAGRPVVAVKLMATDDHGLGEVKLVMTVAKGSGEGVKFREQEVALASPASAVEGGGQIFVRDLDLIALGLEPGDELYFHAFATDRRSPLPNRTRSETRFVILRGPGGEMAEPGTAVAGVNLVPQYFRSQRQLIIDTERLLAERPALTEEKFRERSEAIGIDQKLLRLRYGQFLGEEFEPDASGAPGEAHELRNGVPVDLIHDHDAGAADRAGAVERVVEMHEDDHAATPDPDGRPKTAKEIAAPFVHQHDNADAATLFDLQLKASLRGVLSAMWEAEGFLRTVRPAEALPAEHRALDMLKALQQADRVYVKRVGFEPAPLKVAERRLRGELEAIPSRAFGDVPVPERSADTAALGAALAWTGGAGETSLPNDVVTAVDARLVAAAREKPEAFVHALEIWRRRAQRLSDVDRAVLRKAIWSLLPPLNPEPTRLNEPAPALSRAYAEALTGQTGSSR